MGVVSLTDEIAARQLEALLRGRGTAGDLLRFLPELLPGMRKPAAPHQPSPEARHHHQRKRSALERLTPELRDAAPAKYTLHLTYETRREIVREIRGNYWDFGQRRLETGGHLLGLRRPRHADARIVYATGPGPNSRHSTYSVAYASAEIVQDGFPDWLKRSDLRICGDWHLQPRHATPSPVDLRGWAHRLQQEGWSRYVAVIVNHGSGAFGWEHPDLYGWVTRPNYDAATGRRDGYVTEPARIRIEGEG